MTNDPKIDMGRMDALLSPESPLLRTLKDFEPREQQRQMVAQVASAYQKNEIALIEAETGTGKSIAYLIPALFWAVEKKERTLISTHTITLQEQLLHKDIPMLLNAMGVELSVVLAKGMGNYLCFRKLDEQRHELLNLLPQEKEAIEKMEAWSTETKDGTLSDLPFSPTPKTWEKVSAEADSCTWQKCPHYERCFFFKAREAAAQAQIVIVNHHLLLADLAMREKSDNYEKLALLPPTRRLIIDEAHHIEDVATNTLAKRTGYWQMHKIVGRIGSEKQGKLAVVKKNLEKQYFKEMPPEVQALLRQLHLDLIHLKSDLQIQIDAAFQTLQLFMEKRLFDEEESEPIAEKLRLTTFVKQDESWESEVVVSASRLIEAIKRFRQSLHSFLADIAKLKNEKLEQSTAAARKELLSMAERLSSCQETIEAVMITPQMENHVQWLELSKSKTYHQVQLVSAELDLSETLVRTLFRPIQTVIMCSATLTTNQRFDYMRQRLGIVPNHLPDRRVTEQQYPSPFDYQKQALLLLPNDLPQPHQEHYLEALSEHIWQSIRASRGNAFVLFTSFQLLNRCSLHLAKRLQEGRFLLLKHGEEMRHQLLRKFREIDRSVLFGTYSFWEGVDIPGEALRCVIIVKLPFQVPSEPLVEARAERIAAQGGDPFNEYSLPQAILKFKQGFGRLIRKKRDRGCIVCLDSRLVNRPYGSLFLRSLPNCQQRTLPGHELYEQMSDFYRKTYFLVKHSS